MASHQGKVAASARRSTGSGQRQERILRTVALTFCRRRMLVSERAGISWLGVDPDIIFAPSQRTLSACVSGAFLPTAHYLKIKIKKIDARKATIAKTPMASKR